MSLNPWGQDLDIIIKQPDEPSLAPNQLKAEFDKAGNYIKNYINNTLIPEINEKPDDADLSALQSAIDSLNSSVSAAQAALTNKVDKVSGKGLSTNDFTTVLLNKLNGINISSGTANPSGGSNGDIYIKYS